MHLILDIIGTIIFLGIFFSFKERQWPHIKDVVQKNDIREIKSHKNKQQR